MKNAHERMCRLRYDDDVGSVRANVEVYCERVVADDEQTHLLSFFGTDSATSAMVGALYDQRTLDLLLPNEGIRPVRMGQHLEVRTSNISIPGHRHPLRHKVVLSEAYKSNGASGAMYLLNNYDPVLSWGLISEKIGLPSIPEWSDHMMTRLEQRERIEPLFGFNCSPVRVLGTRKELLGWIGEAVRGKFLLFPENNISLVWPEFDVLDAVYGGRRGAISSIDSADLPPRIHHQQEEAAASVPAAA